MLSASPPWRNPTCNQTPPNPSPCSFPPASGQCHLPPEPPARLWVHPGLGGDMAGYEGNPPPAPGSCPKCSQSAWAFTPHHCTPEMWGQGHARQGGCSAWCQHGPAPGMLQKEDPRQAWGKPARPLGFGGVTSPPSTASGIILKPLFIPVLASKGRGRALLSDTNPV